MNEDLSQTELKMLKMKVRRARMKSDAKTVKNFCVYSQELGILQLTRVNIVMYNSHVKMFMLYSIGFCSFLFLYSNCN